MGGIKPDRGGQGRYSLRDPAGLRFGRVLDEGVKGHVLIAGVHLERIGWSQLGLLVGLGEGDLSTRLGVAEEGRHGVVPTDAGAGGVNATPYLDVLQLNAFGFAKGLGSLGENILG